MEKVLCKIIIIITEANIWLMINQHEENNATGIRNNFHVFYTFIAISQQKTVY